MTVPNTHDASDQAIWTDGDVLVVAQVPPGLTLVGIEGPQGQLVRVPMPESRSQRPEDRSSGR